MGRTLNGEIVSLSVIETPRAFPTTGAPAAETTVGNSAFNPELTTFLHSTVPMSSTLMYPHQHMNQDIEIHIHYMFLRALYNRANHCWIE